MILLLSTLACTTPDPVPAVEQAVLVTTPHGTLSRIAPAPTPDESMQDMVTTLVVTTDGDTLTWRDRSGRVVHAEPISKESTR